MYTFPQVSLPKSILNRLVLGTCYVLHPTLSNIYDHEKIIVSNANHGNSEVQTAPVLSYLVLLGANIRIYFGILLYPFVYLA